MKKDNTVVVEVPLTTRTLKDWDGLPQHIIDMSLLIELPTLEQFKKAINAE